MEQTSMSTTNKTILYLDQSSLKKSACDLAWWRIVVAGYSDFKPYNDTLYGSAFHEFVKLIAKTKGDFAASWIGALAVFRKPCMIREGKEHLTEKHLQTTCINYWDYAGDGKDLFETLCVNGEPLVEQNFFLPVHEDDNLIIALSGTVDRLGKFHGGCYGFTDFKTHSLWYLDGKKEAAIRRYFKTYDLSLQLRFYTYCVYEYVRRNPDSPLAVLCKNHALACAIDGVFISKNETVFGRSDVWVYTEDEMNEFDLLVRERVSKLVHLFYNEPTLRHGLITGHCVDQRFPCMFKSVCAQENLLLRQHLLNTQFEKRAYEPLKFGKE